MEVHAQLQSPAAFSREICSGLRWIGGWVCTRASVEVSEGQKRYKEKSKERKILEENGRKKEGNVLLRGERKIYQDRKKRKRNKGNRNKEGILYLLQIDQLFHTLYMAVC